MAREAAKQKARRLLKEGESDTASGMTRKRSILFCTGLKMSMYKKP